MTLTQGYLDGIELKNNTVEAVYNEEGRASNNGGTFRYEYALRDHLGNTRVVFTDKNNSGNIDNTEILSETHYYPFGKAFDGAWYNDASASKYKYLYNGKELSEEFDLNFYDYGARWLDPGLGSWWEVDPKAETGRRWSPYTYAFGNPLRFIDPDGMWPWSVNVRSFISGQSAGGGLFYADNRGPSFTGSSRVYSNFTVDPTNRVVTQPFSQSDRTIFYGAMVGPTYISPIVDRGSPKGKNENITFANNTASFDFSHSGKDPITFQPLTPALDVHAGLSFNEDMKKGTLNITGSFTGDQFPSTEAFITDQSGKTKLFLGAQMEQGGVGDLYGDNKQPLFNVNMQVNFDNKGNFTGVTQGNTNYSVSDWNKKVQEGFNK